MRKYDTKNPVVLLGDRKYQIKPDLRISFLGTRIRVAENWIKASLRKDWKALAHHYRDNLNTSVCKSKNRDIIINCAKEGKTFLLP